MTRISIRSVLTGALALVPAIVLAQTDDKPAAPDNPAIQSSAGPVQYFSHDAVKAGFAKGGPLLETPGYKVLASRRDRDGIAEVHARDTDVIYVLEGTATLVTGGRVENGKTTAPDEIRGDSIVGGDVKPLVAGEVVVIPNGVPHLFKDVKAPFLYFVVKATAPRP